MAHKQPLEDVARDIPSYTNPDPRAVAIVGMSISAPGGVDYGLDTEEFYAFLQNRGSGIITVPSDRWNAEAFHGTGPGKISTTKGGFIPDIRYADLQEFGITPVEGQQISTSQMLVLHQAFTALQRSGIDYRGTNTGVYVGSASSEATLFEMDVTQAGPYYMTGTTNSIVANRLSYSFDLLGPSLPIDTACSSALAAMHLAIQAVRNGECDQAVVAGANAVRSALECVAFSQLGVLSPDGISKSFDEDGNGYARGDVASAVVIKRHDLAVKDHDRIHATLVGTAMTSCGSIMGSLTTPSPEAQASAIQLAYRDAGLEPHQADFVELHGTGTVVGDATEANSAGAVFAAGRDGREVLIGSVKSNVGHGELGAYMTSLVKVAMMLERKEVLPNGYFKKPSSRIDFEKFKLRVPVSVEKFAPGNPQLGRIASISSYGFGGAGGHTVLREHEPRPTLPGHVTLQEPLYLFAVGALSLKGCVTLGEKYKEEYREVDPLALCEHLGNRARQLPWRSFAIAGSIETAAFPEPVLVPKRPHPLVFCFSGQGPQHWQQGRELYRTFKVFRDSINDCDRVHVEYTGESFIETTGLFKTDAPKDSGLASSPIWPSDVTSISLTFFQIALFDLLTSLNLKPDTIVGHSVGETAVLYASGAVPRSMAVKIAIARGKALAKVDNTGGGMVAVSGCDADKVRDYAETAITLAGLDVDSAGGPQLFLASFNSPTDIGVSGSEKHLEVFASFIERWVSDVVARKLRINTAVHSPFVDPCESQYRRDLATIFAEYPGPHIPKIPTMSTVTAEFKTDSYTPDYLWNNLRQPVLFSSAIPKVVERLGELTTFIEVAPHPVLSQYLKQMGALDALACSRRPPSARHVKPGSSALVEVRTLLEVLGRLLLVGVNKINFSELAGCPDASIDGPAYPFQPKLWRYGMDEPSYLRKLLPVERPLNSIRLRVSPIIPEPWMGDHLIDHTNLIPASAYLEMALEFPDVTQLYDCRFAAMYVLDESGPPGTLEVSRDGKSWWVKSSSQIGNPQGDMEWTRTGPSFDTLHSCGKLGYGPPEIAPDAVTHVDLDEVLSRCPYTFDRDSLYGQMEGLAQFGPEFKRVLKASCNEKESLTYIKGHVDGLNQTDYAFHPALLDAVFQSPLAWNMIGDKLNLGSKNTQLLLPHSVRRMFRNDGSNAPVVLPDEFVVYSVLHEWSPHHWVTNCYVLGEDQSVIYTVEGLRFALIQRGNEWPSEHFKIFWQPRDLPQSQLESSVVLPGPPPRSDDIELLHVLDQLAVHFTKKTIDGLPHDYVPTSPDRKRYLAWANAVATKLAANDADGPAVPEHLREKYQSLFDLTQRVGAGQKDIMASSTAAVELLFCDDIMSKIYEHPPFIGSVFDATTSRFIDLVTDALNAGKQVVRVLEVGAGTGRFTALLGRALLEAALPEGCYVDYVCTDVSISLAQEATAKSPWPTVTAKAFDLNVAIGEQNLDPRSFDIVVAFDVLHATPDIHASLTTLQQLLCPGGHIAILELDGENAAPLSWSTIEESQPALIHAGSKPVLLRHFTAGGEVALVDFISSLDSTYPYLFWLYTTTSPGDAAAVGLVRTLRQEYPTWKIHLALFPDSWTVTAQEAYVHSQLILLPWVDSEVMIDQDGKMHVPRLVKASPAARQELRGSHPVSFRGSDVWRAYPAELGPNDVEVSVHYVGLTPAMSGWTEFAGAVTAVGSGVLEEDLVGRRVFGVTVSVPGSTIVCDRSKLAFVPQDMETALATALVGRLMFLSLVVVDTVGTSSKNTKVLLHAGHCSPAALATYAYLSANSFDVTVTVSDASSSTNTFSALSSISSSKYYAWSSRVRAWAPRGVDVVFNFDEDVDVAKQTLSLLSSRGRFVQIGGELPSSLPSGRRYVSIEEHAVLEAGNDLDRTDAVFSPAVLAALPPSVDIYNLPQLMTADVQARNSMPGRVALVDLQAIPQELPVLKAGMLNGTAVFNPRASYVIVGGIGGLGVNLARCLVENGAKHLILTSRSGEKGIATMQLARERKIVNYLRGIPGVTVDLRAVDVLDAEMTRDLFMNLEHPVAGVFYLAVRLNDQVFANLKTEEDWKIGKSSILCFIYDVKIKGVEVLLQAVNPQSLDFLVLTSSMATVCGSPGQANYSAAQTYMETMAAALPNTVAITVPPITDGGVFVRSLPPGNARNAALDKYKSLGMTGYLVAQHCVNAIWTLNCDAYNPVYIPPTDWKEIMQLGIPEYHLSSLRHLLTKQNVEIALATEEWSIRAACASVLALDTNEVADNVPLASYGLDSLTSVRLSGILKTNFNVSVTQLQLLGNSMTVQRLMALQEELKADSSSAVVGTSNKDSFDVLGAEGVHHADMDKTIVRLNSVTDGQPVFIVHGAGGGVLVMLKTAEMMSCPVYGVQDTPDAPITGTLDKLCRFYLEKIREKQPKGPYRLGGFSFGTYAALVIAQLLQEERETVELLIMIDGSPAIFTNFAKRINVTNMRDEIMTVIRDLAASGTLESGEELTAMFEDHFKQVAQGGSSGKFVSQFGRAFVAHVLMAVRACISAIRQEQVGETNNSVWPTARTVVIRADDGIGRQWVSEGLSPAFDVDLRAPDAEFYMLPGTHFGVLHPQSGLPQLLEQAAQTQRRQKLPEFPGWCHQCAAAGQRRAPRPQAFASSESISPPIMLSASLTLPPLGPMEALRVDATADESRQWYKGPNIMMPDDGCGEPQLISFSSAGQTNP
ncbi:polyketide synthase [Hydnomerulius pinastri MD-312]|uniref:Pks2 protein n=1 Tax=Hydnomerulius pinastri MD-312 TaxID=994086 RepID=A0A0C9VSG5_9AGAM|nr:polyketide synthase [Hydnomerulius pinastri MD-312]